MVEAIATSVPSTLEVDGWDAWRGWCVFNQKYINSRQKQTKTPVKFEKHSKTEGDDPKKNQSFFSNMGGSITN